MNETSETPKPKYFGEYTETEKEQARARLRQSSIFKSDITDERLDEIIMQQTNWMAENPEKFASSLVLMRKVLDDPLLMESIKHVAQVVSKSGGLG